jgi:hypothetical protein
MVMCRRKLYQTDMPVMASEGRYEGQTIRLNARATGDSESGSANHRASFPWWVLWLIWPLIGLVKWFVPLYASAATLVFAQLGAAGAAPFVAIVLIVAGLVLIGRR